jgi:EAL domain-containing protein (putative c-di-GMP-specific phosphodiesterase class I)/CHASE2 domain-containing sensor protein
LAGKRLCVHTTDKPVLERSPWRLLLWTALVGLVIGLVGFGELAEDKLRMSRNNFHPHSASGDIVLVTIDDRALREVGRWPWPRRRHAELVDRLTEAGAKRIFFDIMFETLSTPVDDKLLAGSLERSGRVVLPIRAASGPHGLVQPGGGPIPMLRKHAQLASITVSYDYQNAVWDVPYSVPVGRERFPSLAAKLAEQSRDSGEFTPDYSLKLGSIPTIGAKQVLDGRFDPRSVRGKDVVIGANSEVIGDQYFIPGVGKASGVFIQIVGAETLKAGPVTKLGWLPAFLLALALTCFAATRQGGRKQSLIFGAATAVLLVAPVFLEANRIFLDVTPALFVVLTVWSMFGWRSLRRRGLVDPVSGLPNLAALKLDRSGRDRALIAARILNYAEIVATLPPNSEAQLVDQIVSRLSVGAPARIHYHGDSGIFAWFADPKMPFGHHLDALYALFRNPVTVGGLSIDLSVSFGVEVGSSRSLANRLGSALLAAEEAAHDGLKWKYYDPDSLQDASWRLSMLSQLDQAVDHGEVWVAYQPKVDLKTRQIVGAEALARWTHPEKGPIAASEFIAAAEQHDRIGKLTSFVLEEAVAAAAAVNQGREFEIAVNLSGRLLSDRGLVGRIAILLEKHRLDARHLTLELTETAALAGSGDALEMLMQLRQLGVQISIDDYGTGLSTLEYLKRIPAGEIKIDQSFIKGMTDNRSERLMVQSTIALAHSLGRTVVAEGVETREALELLAEMECDIVQGFIVGRPMSLESLRRRLAAERRSRVA